MKTTQNMSRIDFAVAGVLSVCVGGSLALAGDEGCVTFDPIGLHSLASSFSDTVIEVDGTTLYGGHGWGGFDIFDISDPLLPIHMGSTVLEDYFPAITGIELHGSLAYVSVYSPDASTNGLYIVDVSDMNAPVEIGHLSGLALVTLDVVRNLVYTTNGVHDTQSLHIIDVSDSISPTLISSTLLTGFSDLSSGIEVLHGRAYIANGDNGLIIYDVGNPLSPLLLGSLDTQGIVTDLQIIGNTVYLADGADGLKVIDVSNPSTPTLIGSYSTASQIRHIDVRDTICYATVLNTGVFALDIEDPSSITLLGSYLPEDSQVADIVVHGDILYSADLSRLRVDAIINTCPSDCPMDADCPADVAGDGVLNFHDVSIFLGLFVAQDPRADFQCDGEFNFFDVTAFLGAYIAGCP